MLKMRLTEELVESATAGNADAFGELVILYEKAAWLTAWRVLREHHLALDATQNAFIEAFRQLPQLRSPSRFGSWLMKITHREAIKLARGASRNKSIVYDYSFRATSQSPESDELVMAVANLPAHERLLIVLRYFGGYSIETIVQLTGRPTGTVTKQLSRAIARLKLLLGSFSNDT